MFLSFLYYSLMLCCESVKEARLLVLNAQFLVNGGEDALHLSKGEHTTEERVTGIVAFGLIAQHRHTVVHAHRQSACTLLLLLLEDVSQLHKVGAAAQVTCLGEVAVREYVA